MNDKVQRYQRIMSRQGSFSWTKEFQPAIRATRAEGPKCSRLSQIWSAQLRRTIHLLSSAERVFAQLALYNPHLFDLHEQRMLSPVTAAHPLQGHPRSVGMQLPKVLGTVEIATMLGGRHDRLYVLDKQGEEYAVPYPYVGDLLLFLEYPDRLPYCVNWTIKSDQRDFSEQRRTKLKSLADQKKDQSKADYRQRVEREHYEAAGIRTLQLSPDCIDEEVRFNLDFLYGWLGLESQLEAAVEADFDDEVREEISLGRPLSRVVLKYAARWGVRDQLLGRIYQNIWNRKLKVDLFAPLLIDKPFSVRPRDVLDVYGSLFAEVAP